MRRSARTSTTTASWSSGSPRSRRLRSALGQGHGGRLRLDKIVTDTDAVARNSAAIAADRSAAAGNLADQATVAGIVALVLTPVLLILLGLWLARVVADPLRQTVVAASAVAAGNFDVRLNDRRRDEFGELAHVFNAMTESLAASRSELIERAESLAQSERHKSELISMVSHEVRTPLASVLGSRGFCSSATCRKQTGSATSRSSMPRRRGWRRSSATSLTPA